MDVFDAQVTLHTILRQLSAQTGIDVWQIIQTHLASVHAQGRRSRVLDLGCGTGIFSYDLGKDHQFVDVIGADLDLTNVGSGVEEGSPWDNVDFSQIDVTQPLPYSAGTFDIVHFRNLAASVPHYLQLIERSARILKPGGLLIITEQEHFFHTAIPNYAPGLPLRTWQTALREALQARSIDPHVPSRLRMLISNSGVFESGLQVEELSIPLCQTYAGCFHPEMVAAFLETLEPVLLAHGYGADDVARLNTECVAELTGVDNRYFQRVTTVCATKVG